MINKRELIYNSVSLICLISLSGCDVIKPVYFEKKGVEKFTTICKHEFRINIKTFRVGKTLWIYAPIEEPIFKFKASADDAPDSYIDPKSIFDGNKLTTNYSIKPLESINKGITSAQTDKGNKYFSNIFEAIYSSFGDSKEDIDFFVVVISDIVNGVDIIYQIYKPDLIKMFSNTLGLTEPTYRIFTDTLGSSKIIGDRSGKHINPYELDLGTFLTKQIEQRIRYSINFDYDIEEQILEIITFVINSYDFKDFAWIELIDLDATKKTTMSRAALLGRIKESLPLPLQTQ